MQISEAGSSSRACAGAECTSATYRPRHTSIQAGITARVYTHTHTYTVDTTVTHRYTHIHTQYSNPHTYTQVIHRVSTVYQYLTTIHYTIYPHDIAVGLIPHPPILTIIRPELVKIRDIIGR